MKTVPLHGKVAAGRIALVDDEDCELVSQYRWFVSERPQARNTGINGPYAVANLRSPGLPDRSVRMHVLIMGRPYIDHINHDGLDNQRENLRPATWVQNSRNMQAMRDGSSRYKGVSFHSLNGRWRARIKTGTGRVSLGVYATEEEAARAYDAAARRYFGKFAFLNFPEEPAA